MLKHASLNNLCLFLFINVTVILFASINWTYKHYYSQYSMNCNYQQSLIVEGETNTLFNFVLKEQIHNLNVLFSFQFQRKKCKESAVNQKMEYLLANKGLIATVLISAALIFAVVVAMLATTDGHSHSAHSSKHIVHVHNVTEMP